jgi:hypothetical protein
MLRRLDQSEFLINLVNRLSDFLARRRGLPIIVGIVFIAIGFVLQLLNVAIGSNVLDILQIIFHDVGLILALVGILLTEPLGGY